MQSKQVSPAVAPAAPSDPGPQPSDPGAQPSVSGARASNDGVDRSDRWGWWGVAAITAFVAATWARQPALPLGDNHIGRIFARHALHLRNYEEKGLVGSAYTADWSPYSSGAYAHHPPLLNIFDVLFGALPGSGPHEVMIGPYLLAVLMVPAAAALLRGLGIRWSATLLAVGLMAATNFFWLYTPLMFDMPLILALTAAVVRLRREPHPPRWLVVAGCAAALLTTLASWPGIALAAVLGLWLWAGRRRLDRVTLAVGASMVVGVALSALFVVGVTGWEALTGQTSYRTAGGDFTAREFLARQFRFARQLLPIWYLVLLPVAVVAGLLDRRTRWYAAVATAFAAGWVLVLNNGSFIHDYWAYPVLIPGVIGTGVLGDRLAGWIGGRRFALGALVVAAGLTFAFAKIAFGGTAYRHIEQPVLAGQLVAEHSPAPGQRFAWAPAISAPRWLAYYWDLPAHPMDEQVLAEQARPEDLVLLRADRLPPWIPKSALDAAVAREGRYALVRVADIRAAQPG